MVKVRSKMKKKVGGKKWSHASTSVPTISKHRVNAKSRFFRPNLSLKPSDNEKPSGLTMEAVLKHEAIQNYSGKDPTVNDIAHSLKSFSMSGIGGDDDMMSESNLGTFKTFKTFASNFSACTNMSFSKFLNHFRSDSEQHKEMLAILAALTEVIKERGGSQTSTEYFLALMETIENSKETGDTVAAVSLLAMGIKTVPQAVLRKKFSDVGQILLDLMERFVASTDLNILRSVIGCLSVLLRAQEYSQWQMPKTLQFFDTILTFVTHTKPRIRKAAQHAVVSILFDSAFMVPPKSADDDTEVLKVAPVKLHPASGRVAKFCVAQFKPENVTNNQTIVLHTLGLLQNAMAAFNKDDIKVVAENLLSIMTSPNLLIRTTCFQTFHHLFQSKTANLTAPLTGKLVSALYEYRPDKTDTQTLAWLTVLKEAHIFLAGVNLQMCSTALPRFVEVCCTDLWLSDKTEIINGASNVLRELFLECVRPCCVDANEVAKHRVSIDKVLEIVGKTLSAPFGPATKHILSLYAVIFEVCGRHFGETLAPALATLGRRYEPESANRLQIEHTVLAAIATVDTKILFTSIPLHEPTGEMSLNRSWLLPLLRQGLVGSSLELFNNYVLKLAYACYTKWQKLKALNNVTQSHVNELLCCQLWGLFPGFCRRPRDIGNFKLLAKTLGTVLNENPDLRSPILDGFLELIPNLETDDEKHEVGKFAKNFLPRLFNIYTTKPKGGYENEVRQQAFEVIRVYCNITPPAVLHEMFTTALEQFGGKAPGTFLHDMLFDIVEALALHQTKDVLVDLYDRVIVPAFDKERTKMEEKGKVDFNVRRQLKKAYKLLLNIVENTDKPACAEFVDEKLKELETILLSAVDTTFESTQAMRLACLKQLLLKQPALSTQTELLHQVIPEVVLAFSNETVKKERTATDMIRIIGDTFEQEQKLNEFVDVLLMGFVGDSVILTNTIWVLRDLVTELTGNLTVDSLKFMVEQVVAFVTSNNRKEAEASVTFLVTFTKVLPPALVANHLPLIVKALSAMTSDTKRHLRILLGFLLKKLCNKFGGDEIARLVPGNDEQTHKRLRKIRKEMSRAKRNRDGKKKGERGGAGGDSDDEDLDAGLEKKSQTIDDILADSDSDASDAESDDGKQKSRAVETYIREDPDMIVDLADVDVMNKITSSQPGSAATTDGEGRKKVKKPNRGFKTAADGRFIIKMDERHSDDDDSADEIEGFADKAKKRVYDESDDSDGEAEADDVAEGSSRKKKAVEGSVKSGWSGASSKYAPGGKGIHRPVAQSVKSGYSKSSQRTAATTTKAGSEYSSRKAKGDMKKKGKLEPYAYIPLSRNSLNRRKRAKNTTQFKSIVEGARKGAAAGAKNRIVELAKTKKRSK